MRPYDMGKNFMYNDMTMGMGLNPFSSNSMLGVSLISFRYLFIN